jgi:hypothetical protein
MTKDKMFHIRTRHFNVRYHFSHGVNVKGSVKLCKISTHDNPSNILTKLVPGTMFELSSGLVGILYFFKTLVLCDMRMHHVRSA